MILAWIHYYTEIAKWYFPCPQFDYAFYICEPAYIGKQEISHMSLFLAIMWSYGFFSNSVCSNPLHTVIILFGPQIVPYLTGCTP